MKYEMFEEKMNYLGRMTFEMFGKTSEEKKQKMFEYWEELRYMKQNRFEDIVKYLVNNYDSSKKQFPRISDFKTAERATYKESDYIPDDIDSSELATPDDYSALKLWAQERIETGRNPKCNPINYFTLHPDKKPKKIDQNPILSETIDEIFF